MESEIPPLLVALLCSTKKPVLAYATPHYHRDAVQDGAGADGIWNSTSVLLE